MSEQALGSSLSDDMGQPLLEVDEFPMDFQFFEELGEGLTNLLDTYFGGDSYAATCRIIEWLRNGDSTRAHAEVSAMLVERKCLILAPHTRGQGTLDTNYAKLVREARDTAQILPIVSERFSSLDRPLQDDDPIPWLGSNRSAFG